MYKVTKELFKHNSLAVCAIKKNGFAAAAASDPIQKLFLDKIKEYSKKASSAPNGLVDANQNTSKLLEEELGELFKIDLEFRNRFTNFSYPYQFSN